MMKHTLALFTALLLAPLGAISAAAPSPRHSRPNLLFLITDQQTIGAPSCAGNPYVKTPNLDRLAVRACGSRNRYCTYPLCCPSRGSLFTSRTPHELGIYRNNGCRAFRKRACRAKTLGELFQAAGYETAYAGKWHIQVPFPGFSIPGGPPDSGFTVLPMAGRIRLKSIR